MKITSIVAFFISCCIVNAQEDADFKRFVHQTSWAAYASNQVNTKEQNMWYQANEYHDSIYKVIATAIADCKTQNNEFSKKVDQDGIIEFDATPDKVPYKQKHWNALILYNFIGESLNDMVNTGLGDEDKVSEKCIEAIGQKVAEYYSAIQEIDNKIEDAVNVIKDYAKSLNLYEYLRYLRNDAQNEKRQGYYLNTLVSNKGRDVNGVTKVDISDALIKTDADPIACYITICYKDKNELSYMIDQYPYNNGRYVILNDDMTIKRNMTYDEPTFSRPDMRDILHDESITKEQREAYEKLKNNIVQLQALSGSSKMMDLVKKMNDPNKKDGDRQKVLEQLYNKLQNVQMDSLSSFNLDSLANVLKNAYTDRFIQRYQDNKNLYKYTGEQYTLIKDQQRQFDQNFNQSENVTFLVEQILQTMQDLYPAEAAAYLWNTQVTTQYQYKNKTLQNPTSTKEDKVDSVYKIKHAYFNQLCYDIKFFVKDYKQETNRADQDNNEMKVTKITKTTCPDIIICEPESDGETIKGFKTNNNLTLTDAEGEKNYQLASVITKDVKTGEIYAEIHQEGKYFSRTHWNAPTEVTSKFWHEFKENDPGKIRLLAIYERQK